MILGKEFDQFIYVCGGYISFPSHSVCICIYTQREEYIGKKKVMQRRQKGGGERRRQQVEHLFDSFGYLKSFCFFRIGHFFISFNIDKGGFFFC